MGRNTGTRSGLLWEVERLLTECQELGELPQVLLMENVPEVVGTKNIKHFEEWLWRLEQLGYTNKWQILNGKDYGIPQNRRRCFMVSILGDYEYEFPNTMPLRYRLKDVLQKNVDEKYYLSDRAIKGIENTQFNCSSLEARTEKNGVIPTLCARDYKDPKLVQVAQLEGNYESNGRVYSDDGVAPTINTCGGGNREPKIAESDLLYMGTFDYNKSDNFLQGKNRLKENAKISDTILTTHTNGVVFKEPVICASRGRNPENPSSRKSGEPTEQRLEINPSGCSNTLTTVQKDNYVLEPNLKQQLCDELIEKGLVKEGDMIRHSYTNSRFDSFHIENSENPDCSATIVTRADTLGVVVNEDEKDIDNPHAVVDAPRVIGGIGGKKSNGGTQWYQQDRIYDDKVALTVTTGFNPYYKANYRIRKLTPTECLRLMGVKDEDIALLAKNQSNASMYHLAGDSIITTCLMALFGQLLGLDWRDYFKEELWWNNK